MAVLPKTDRSLIAWVRARLSAWGKSPPSIGLDAATLAEIIALSDAAEDARAAAESARNASESATLRLHLASAALRERTAAAVATIKSFAETGDDPGVYVAALIPSDRAKSPLGPPPTPTGVDAGLLPGGAVRLSWRGTRKGGTLFLVHRALVGEGGSQGPFTLVDTTTRKQWTDGAVPAGLRGVAYAITAERHGGRSGRSNAAWLSFGSEGVGAGARRAA